MDPQMRSDFITRKLKELPKSSGVYLFRDLRGKIIYVGKAVNLKNRVRSYFVGTKDIKTQKLVSNILNLEWMETDSEIGALFLESELIKRYKPKYNIELKDDKNFVYIKIPKEDFPLPVFVRNPSDDKSKYLGPFTDAGAVKRILKIMRKVFPHRSKGDLTAKRPCLYYHIGQCPGVCVGKVSKKNYQKNIRGLTYFFEGKSEKLRKEFEKEMKKASKEKDFEKAAVLRDKIIDLKKVNKLHILEKEDFGKNDIALLGLKKTLSLKELPRRIECFDISNISGKDAVGSMIVFQDGLPKKEDYRKFKIRLVKGISDTAMMEEVLRRRFGKITVGLPNLIIVDGGKGQLGAAISVLNEFGIQIPVIGLAKKNEEIFQKIWDDILKSFKFKKIILPGNSESLYLLQRTRDEAHRFAITYFRSLHGKTAKKSILDDISGIGPKTKKKLIKEFGSVSGIKNASAEELGKAVGERLAVIIKKFL